MIHKRCETGRPVGSGCPSVVIMDGQSVKTTERGGIRDFDARKCVKGRKRHILVDSSEFRSHAGWSPPTCRIESRELGCSPVWVRYFREFGP